MKNIFDWFLGGFTSWKTTLAGLIGAIFLLLHNVLGYPIVTTDQLATVVAFIVFVIGYFSKDSNAVGKPTDDSE